MTPKRGDRFEHARQITGSPKAGTARPVVMEVTRVTSTTVYYRPVGADPREGAWYCSTVEKFPAVVGAWLVRVPVVVLGGQS